MEKRWWNLESATFEETFCYNALRVQTDQYENSTTFYGRNVILDMFFYVLETKVFINFKKNSILKDTK